MLNSSLLDSPQLLAYPAAIVLLIVGLGLTIRRLMLGYLIVGLTASIYSVWYAYQGGWQLVPMQWASLGLILLLTLFGASMESISERLHFRMGWVNQNTVWGGLIGGMIALFLLNGVFWMLLGTLIGTVASQFTGRVRRERFDQALLNGLEGFYSMFGAVGLRVLFATVVIDLFLSLAGTLAQGSF